MYKRLAEWANKKIIILAWPFDETLWGKGLKPAQREFLALVEALELEKLLVLVPNAKEEGLFLQSMNLKPSLSTLIVPYADIWLRDTLFIVVKNEDLNNVALIPKFNGWGNKYLLKNDETLAYRLASHLDIDAILSDIVFEGGAIECDGLGTMLSTESCLLNKNRNPLLIKKDIEDEFYKLLGIKKIIWLNACLKNDHTDGHVDTLARFLAPSKVAIMIPKSESDHNYKELYAIREQLIDERDVLGKNLELIEIPSPGPIRNSKLEIMPASYLNFLRGDNTIIVPLYGSKHDDEALSIFKRHFESEKNVIGLSAKAILNGGGAFHCISQELWI